MKNKPLKTIDLFAGIGGIRSGFEEAGYTTVYANDFDPYCKKTYDLNFDSPKLDVRSIIDIKEKELPAFDILLAGFPCQPFSIAGMRKGFDDKDRGNMFFEIERILKERKPIAFLLENVKNLKSHDKGNTYKVIREKLESLGYFVKEDVLNSAVFGNVPQNRERFYIVGFLEKDKCDKFNFPKEIKPTIKITDILQPAVDDKYYYNNKPLFEKIKDYDFKKGVVYQWRRKYIRENKTGVCPTLTANMGTGGHNVPIVKDSKGVRKLTPKECSLLQGFPMSYKIPQEVVDSRLYKQLGNSVTVPVVKRIAEQMKKVLEG